MNEAQSSDKDPSRYHFDGRQFLQAEWLTVFDGGLSQPVDVKFEISRGRVQIVGLRIDNGSVLTARTLRELRVSELEQILHDYLRSEREDLSMIRTRAEQELVEDGEGERRTNARQHLRDVDEWESELNQAVARVTAIQTAGAVEFTARGRGAKPPTEDDYLAFARLYLKQLSVSPRGAVSRTAQAAGMDRSTVYRWLEVCRTPDRRYVP